MIEYLPYYYLPFAFTAYLPFIIPYLHMIQNLILQFQQDNRYKYIILYTILVKFIEYSMDSMNRTILYFVLYATLNSTNLQLLVNQFKNRFLHDVLGSAGCFDERIGTVRILCYQKLIRRFFIHLIFLDNLKVTSIQDLM